MGEGKLHFIYRVIRESLPDRKRYEQRPEESEEKALFIRGKIAPDRRKSKCKGPEVGLCFVYCFVTCVTSIISGNYICICTITLLSNNPLLLDV